MHHNFDIEFFGEQFLSIQAERLHFYQDQKNRLELFL
jgi:hypothetical protein